MKWVNSMGGELGGWWIRSASMGRLGGSCRREDPGIKAAPGAGKGNLGVEGKRKERNKGRKKRLQDGHGPERSGVNMPCPCGQSRVGDATDFLAGGGVEWTEEW